jgi:hypothetical protein
MMDDDPRKWSDKRVLDELAANSTLNHVRKAFSSACARIEQSGAQRKPLTPIELRRMEFEAAVKILDAYGK